MKKCVQNVVGIKKKKLIKVMMYIVIVILSVTLKNVIMLKEIV